MSAGDVVVIGAGHNGLAAAALLARRGRRVLVLERREVVGGLAAGEEFWPGYRGAGLLDDTTGLRPSIVAALELERHGLRRRAARPDVLALGRAGEALMLRGEPARAVEEIGRRSARDAQRYPAFLARIERFRPLLAEYLDRPPLDLVDLDANSPLEALGHALRLRRLGRRDMLELLRLPPMCVADWLDEWFEDDLLKAALALPAVAGTFLGPRSPGSNLNLLLHEAAAGPGVAGDGAALVAALEAAARAHGAEIRTGAEVERIAVEAGAVRGVVLAGGEEIAARQVAASCDPRRALLDLLPPEALSHRTVRRVEGWRMRGTTARVLLALGAAPRFAACPGETVERARIAGGMPAIERAFDAVKYRSIAEEPVLEISVPSIASPGLAPAGHAVMSVLVHYVPHDLEVAWDDAARARLRERVVSILERHAPGLGTSVVGAEVLGPRDIEERYGVTGGQIHHGEHALDQRLVRPVPECLRYATPVEGLYLCGGGSHPGGGLTCAPGSLAAAAMGGGR